MRYWPLALALLAGCAAAPGGPCNDLCHALADTCNYAAYPTFNDCYDGCLYSQQNGGDVASENDCVQAANCDTFQIVECEHAYGDH